MNFTTKYIITLALAIALIFISRSKLAQSNGKTDSARIALTASNNSNTTLPQSSPTPSTAHINSPSATPNSNKWKDGSYTGDSADAYYGFVQIKAVIKNGKITDVQFLDYPQDNGNSKRINSDAMPILTQEAISAQSSNVDIVSGASATSEAFAVSLQSALNQAS